MSNESTFVQARKRRNVTHTTARLPVAYCHIFEPDHGSEQYPVESYQIGLRLNATELKEFQYLIRYEWEQSASEAAEKFNKLSLPTKKKLTTYSINDPWRIEYDRDTEEPTGFYYLTFRTKADWNGIRRVIPVYDANAELMQLDEELGYGTIVRVAFGARPYFVESSAKAGLSLYLEAVQLISPSNWQRDAASYGFIAEEEAVAPREEVNVEVDELPF